MSSPLWLFFPEELLPLLLVASGLLMILGMGKLAASLFVLTIVLAVVPSLFAPIFDAMPMWMLLLVMVGVGTSAAIAAVGLVFRFLFGKHVGTLVLGQLIARAIEESVKGMWWVGRALFRSIWRGVASLLSR